MEQSATEWATQRAEYERQLLLLRRSLQEEQERAQAGEAGLGDSTEHFAVELKKVQQRHSEGGTHIFFYL